MHIGGKLIGSFILLALLLCASSFAGYYGITKVSDTLDFITKPAWHTADGAMELSISIQNQMLALDRIMQQHQTSRMFSPQISFKQVLESNRLLAKKALSRIQEAKLLPEKKLIYLDAQIEIFKKESISILQSYDDFQYKNKFLQQSFQKFNILLLSIIEKKHLLIKNKKNDLLYQDAIQRLLKIQLTLQESYHLYQQLRIEGQIDTQFQAFEQKIAQLELNTAELLHHPVIINLSQYYHYYKKSFSELLLMYSAQYKQQFVETLQKFKNFQIAKKSYLSTTSSLLLLLEEIEELGDAKVENKVLFIHSLESSSYQLVILTFIICLVCLMLIFYMTQKFVVPPLSILQEQLNKLKEGNTDIYKVPSHYGKEFNHLFKTTIQIKNYIDSHASTINTLTQGHYSHKVILHSINDTLGYNLVNLQQRLQRLITQLNIVSQGELLPIPHAENTHDKLEKIIYQLHNTLHKLFNQGAEQNWLKSGQTELIQQMMGEYNIDNLASKSISFISQHLNAQIAALYLAHYPLQVDHLPYLESTAQYAYSDKKRKKFMFGEGLVGQVAIEQHEQLIHPLPENYMSIRSGFGHSNPKYLLLFPFFHQKNLMGVIELGFFAEPSPSCVEFLKHIAEKMAIAFHIADSYAKTQSLLFQSQEKFSALELKQKQLQESNKNLLQHGALLEQQQQKIEEKNNAFKKEHSQIQSAVQELVAESRYKSELLAYVSHELRSPLNNILLTLKQIKSCNDTPLEGKQLTYISTINKVSEDLLQFVADILDLSKIEAGKLVMKKQVFPIAELLAHLQQLYSPIAEKKTLSFIVERFVDKNVFLNTDYNRIQQILNNLLSNAFKFTETGHIIVSIYYTDTVDNIEPPLPKSLQHGLTIQVSDTGTGMSEQAQSQLFKHAFQQFHQESDSQYNQGTGLGLFLTYKLTLLLKSEIRCHSTEEEGSTFSLHLPQNIISTHHALADSSEGEMIKILVLSYTQNENVIHNKDTSSHQISYVHSNKHAYQLLYTESFSAVLIHIEENKNCHFDAMTFLQQFVTDKSLKNILILLYIPHGITEKDKQTILHIKKYLSVYISDDLTELLQNL